MSDESQERTLGRLEGLLEASTKSLASLTQLVAQQGADAAARDANAQIARLETNHRITALEAKVTQIEVPISEFEIWRERGRGALMAGAFAFSILGATIGATWGHIVAWFVGGDK